MENEPSSNQSTGAARRAAKVATAIRSENNMTIQRFETGPRMSQVVVHGNTVYLAGVVANKADGKSATEQTQEYSRSSTAICQSRHRQIEAADGDDLHHRYEDLPRDERGVGRLGIGRQHAGARHRRGQARSAPVQRRDHGGRGEVIADALFSLVPLLRGRDERCSR